MLAGYDNVVYGKMFRMKGAWHLRKWCWDRHFAMTWMSASPLRSFVRNCVRACIKALLLCDVGGDMNWDDRGSEGEATKCIPGMG